MDKLDKTEKYGGTVEVVSSAIIVNKEGKILMIKSHKWGDKYLIPGGHVEHEETLMEAAKREGEEETGLSLKPLYCVNVGEVVNDPNFIRKAHLIYFHFICEALSEDVRLDGVEIKEYVWVEPQKALLIAMDGIKQSIQNYIDGVKININSHTF